jgi:hypothetical protein
MPLTPRSAVGGDFNNTLKHQRRTPIRRRGSMSTETPPAVLACASSLCVGGGPLRSSLGAFLGAALAAASPRTRHARRHANTRHTTHTERDKKGEKGEHLLRPHLTVAALPPSLSVRVLTGFSARPTLRRRRGGVCSRVKSAAHD